MPQSKVNEDRAQFIFEQVFRELSFDWKGPELEFDSHRYKARIQSGDLKGQLLYISIQNLEDRNVSAEHIRQKLLGRVKQELAQIRN
jgi:hypothetical protein